MSPCTRFVARHLVYAVSLTALVVAPRVADGQVIRGQVIDSISGRPVSAGFVVLLDETGQEVFRALTGVSGSFAIRAQAGEYRLRSERIGYMAYTSPPFVLAEGQELSYDLHIATIPTQLSAITVTGSDRCRQSAADAANTATVWEEARKALAAAAWTFDRELYRYSLSLYERRLDRRARRVLEESRRTNEGFTRSPFRSARSAWDLAQNGYVTANPDGSWTYDAPDANVLMSDAFLTTHCLSVVRDRGDTSRVGLAFEPVKGETEGSDISGVLWLDEATARLRRLEYQYTELPHGVEARELGGNVAFMPVSSGAWVIRDWEIRMPSIELDRSGGRERANVVAIRAAGGRVVEVSSPSGELLYAVASTLDGLVFDSTRMEPLEGVVVAVPGETVSASTDSDGWFRLVSLLGGDQTIRMRHPRLDSVGFTFPDVPVSLARGDTVTMVFAVPSLATVRAALCPDSTTARAPGGGRMVYGVVQDQSGVPVPNAVVTAVSLEDESDVQPAQRVYTDDRGWYAVCGVPLNRTVLLQVFLEEQERGGARVRFTSRGIVVNDGPEYRLDVPLFRRDFRVADAERR